MDKKTPEIYQKAIEELDLTGCPPRGTPGFKEALRLRHALNFAARGYTALVVVDPLFINVVAVPVEDTEPKAYVIGLLQQGLLSEALPLLKALSGMIDDVEIEYNLGICFSELGQTEDSLAPLERCITLDPEHIAGLVGLGVAYARLGRPRNAERALREAIYQAPGNGLAKRNLAAVLGNTGRQAEALPLFRQAVSLDPNDPLALSGLAQCLGMLGGTYRAEAEGVYAQLARKFGEHPIVIQDLAARAQGASEPGSPPTLGEAHGSDT